MTILRNELKQGWKSTLIWSLSLSCFAVLSLLLYPQIAYYSETFNKLIERMGLLAQVFNMQDMDVFEFVNYYGLENGNFLGLGGGMFAAVTAISLVAREEGRHTAEYLFPHPISRIWVLAQKFIALVLQVLFLNCVFTASGLLSAQLIGETFPDKTFRDFHVSLLLMNLQVAVLCFGVSCFKKRDSAVPGLGVVLVFYFLNLFINMNQQVATLQYLTPYYYTDIGRINRHLGPLWFYIGLGFAWSGLVLLFGLIHYHRKDLSI